ncbi:MAG: truA [Bacteroidetes bacterium]|nr:truA [Bacteroidota bacterium]
MPRLKLTIEYDGTRYSGWQIQKTSRTVQGEIQQALTRALGTSEVELQGSGRTDAGVHALGQVAHLELKSSVPPDVLRLKLNDGLPQDIHIRRVEPVNPRFHARHHAVARSYLYQISRRRTAFGKKYVWWIKDPLDVPPMQAAARVFLGRHDFRSFTDDEPDAKSTIVQIDRCAVVDDGAILLFHVRGSHFLWKMVRRMVGTLAGIGRGSITADQVQAWLSAPSDAPAKHTAPPSGLFLERVYYEGESFIDTPRPIMTIPHD